MLIIFVITGMNFLVDPFWIHKHENILNRVQKPFNERQQKTNNIYFSGFDYDAIVLGSSRTTYIKQTDFHNMKMYNYALSWAMPFEFKDYIDFTKELSSDDLKYIIIGADFFGTNDNFRMANKEGKYYIQEATSFAYQYKSLINLDATRESIKNIFYSIKGSSRVYYDRHNVKYRPEASISESKKKYEKNIIRKGSGFSNANYIYSPLYKVNMQIIKNTNPNSQCIVFTTPVTDGFLLAILNNEGRLNDYKRWLHELVDVFGSVHHFMNFNEISKNHSNYIDAEHFYPRIGTLIANKISEKENLNIPKDFGAILTKDNINSYLKDFEKELSSYKLD